MNISSIIYATTGQKHTFSRIVAFKMIEQSDTTNPQSKIQNLKFHIGAELTE
jgi:hypothetical protein